MKLAVVNVTKKIPSRVMFGHQKLCETKKETR
jgi:hypothetical protein